MASNRSRAAAFQRNLIPLFAVLVVGIAGVSGCSAQPSKKQPSTSTDHAAASTPPDPYPSGGVANRPSVPAGSLVPIVSFAGVSGQNLEVNAYFPLVETGGMCSLQVNGQNFGNVPAVADATSTWCNPLSAPVGDIGQGPWDIQVTYHSADHDAMSATMKVKP